MCIRVFFHAGVTITNDPLPFMVGQDAVLTCSSDTGVVNCIQWVSRDGVVLASDTSVQQLQLMLKPVNDSLSVHTSNFTCSVTKDEGRRNQTISNKMLPVTVISTGLFSLSHTYMCLQAITYKLQALGDMYLQPSHPTQPHISKIILHSHPTIAWILILIPKYYVTDTHPQYSPP